MWTQGHRVFASHAIVEACVGRLGMGTDRLVGHLRDRTRPTAIRSTSAASSTYSAYMGCQLLRDSDVTSMASSLELRVPLVDCAVASTARSIDAAELDEHAPAPGRTRPGGAGRPRRLPPTCTSAPEKGFALPLRG